MSSGFGGGRGVDFEFFFHREHGEDGEDEEGEAEGPEGGHEIDFGQGFEGGVLGAEQAEGGDGEADDAEGEEDGDDGLFEKQFLR